MKFTYDSNKPITAGDIEHFASIVEPQFFELVLRAYVREQLSVLLRKPEVSEYATRAHYHHDKDGGYWVATSRTGNASSTVESRGDVLAVCVENVATILNLETRNKLQLLAPPEAPQEGPQNTDEILF